MSFLLLIKKNGKKNHYGDELARWVDRRELAKSLCPYTNDLLTQVLSENQVLFHTAISEWSDNSLCCPKGHNKEDCSAWVNVDFKKDHLHVTTDPNGQCPLWYVETLNLIAISPEQKAFKSINGLKLEWQRPEYFLEIKERSRVDFDFVGVNRVPPGACLKINLLQQIVSISRMEFSWESPETNMTIPEAQDLLRFALLKSAKEIPEGAVSLLSGGIDSSVATAITKGILKTYNLKTRLGNEEPQSKETSRYLNIPSETLDFNERQILHYFQSVVYANEVTDGLTAEILLQLRAIFENLPNSENSIVTGYGADFLFGGMLKHHAYLAVTGTKDTASMIHRAYWSKELSPFYYWALGKRTFNLYWHPEVISAAVKIPLSLQNNQPECEKYVLRSLAVREEWLPSEFAFRSKLGMTNGTQMNFLLSEALGLPNEYSFDRKTQIAYEIYQRIMTRNRNDFRRQSNQWADNR